jgi:malate dehydrogenase (oxaloacetate-decarboxylating)
VLVNGAGAVAIAVLKFLMSAGVKNAILCDSKGIIYEGRKENMKPVKEEMAKLTNKEMLKGSLADAIVGADVFIGLSMASDPIVLLWLTPYPRLCLLKLKKQELAL